MKVKYLVLHHSAGNKNATVNDIRKMHINRGWTDIGYHKVINPKGEVFQGRNDSVIGAQAFGMNAESLGVLAVGNWDIEKPPEELINAIVQVMTALCIRHKLSENKIIGHYQVAGIVKNPLAASACPGRFMIERLPEIRLRVKAYLKNAKK